MANSVEVKAEIVENDAGDIVMRLKEYGKAAITFHRSTGASGPKGYEKLKAILDGTTTRQASSDQS
jgi:hypothetical protein